METARIPENLKIEELIEKNPITNIPGFKIDKVYIVCNFIYSQMGLLSDD